MPSTILDSEQAPAPSLEDTLVHPPPLQASPRLLTWWHRLAAPAEPVTSAPLAQREACRQSRLVSAILLVVIGKIVFMVLIQGLFNVFQNLPLHLGMLGLLGVAVWLNRHGHRTSAGMLTVVISEVGIALVVLAHTTSSTGLALLYLGTLVVGVALAAALLPAWTVFVVALGNVAFSWVMLLWLSRTADQTAPLSPSALVIAMACPVAFQGVAALSVYFWVQSIGAALAHAEWATTVAMRERAVATAKASQLTAIFEAMADGVAIYNQQGQGLQLNATLRRLCQASSRPDAPAPQQEDWTLLLPTMDESSQPLAPAQRPLERLLRGEVLTGEQAMDLVVRPLQETAEVLFNVSGAPVRDQDGTIAGAVLVYRDVTERRKLECRTHQALSALLAMAEALVQSPAERVAPRSAGAGAPSLAAYRLAELAAQVLGCRVVSLATLDVARHSSTPLAVIGFPPESERRWWAGERYSVRWLETQPALIARLQAGETLALDARQPPLQDEPNPHEVQSFLAVPMRIGEQLVGLLILDPLRTTYHFRPQEVALAEATGKLGALVIEQERLRREAEEARANELALREANRQMNTFLGIASHELKTPLTSVILGLQVAQRRMHNLLTQEETSGASSPKHKGLAGLLEYLRRLGKQTYRLERLVNDLLDISRIQADKLDLRLELTHLGLLVREVVEELAQATPERTITLHLEEDLDLFVLADVERVGQVVLNYLSNALKYSPEACPVEVEVGVSSEGACVRVGDAGPGIPPEEQERVWERFHRVPGIEVQSGSGVGLGLGLYISRTIIERHGGQVGVESTPGEGSTFWFTLPLAAV